MKSEYDSTNSIATSQSSHEELESLCTAMFDVNPAGMIITALESGRIIEINASMLSALGRTKDECIGKTLIDIGFYTNREMREKAIRFIKANRVVLNREYPFVSRSGKLHYGIFSSRVIEFHGTTCIFSSMIDNTPLVDMRGFFENTAAKLVTLLDSIPDMIFIIDYSGNILKCNRAVHENLGYRRETISKMHILDIHPKKRRSDIVSLIGRILTGEGTRSNIPLVTASGEEIPVETNLVLANWDEKNVIFTISKNVSEMMTIEERQKELQKQLQHAQKMEAIGMLAGGIAHDFNNILFPITAYSEILQDELTDSGQLKGYVQEIHSAAIRAKELVKQILTFSREVSQESQPIQPALIIKEAIKLIRKTVPRSIAIKYHINPECKMVLADPTHIYQIGMNLMINAFHAMESQGGTLEINLDNRVIDGKDHVLISISDTGIGMDSLTIARIYDPYFTTKPKDKGTGLGLSVVHGIVKLYRGTITVNSAPGEGTKFEILIPAIEPEGLPNVCVERDNTGRGTESILFVDDEEAIINPLTRMLKNLGYSVYPFTDSTKALEAFINDPGRFDMVITDLSMPTMSGTQLAAEILRIRPKIPIILCTGFSYNLTQEKVRELGISSLLMKPVIKSELTGVIREVLGSCE